MGTSDLLTVGLRINIFLTPLMLVKYITFLRLITINLQYFKSFEGSTSLITYATFR